MLRPSNYPSELRERAFRMVAEVRPNYGWQPALITAVGVRSSIRISACRRFRSGAGLPRPTAIDLEFQGNTEERPDRNDAAEDGNTLQTRVDGHRADDVRRHEELQS